MIESPMKLYVKVWCPWCVSAIQWLKSHGYAFEQIDVQADPTGYRRMQDISGQSLTPTLELENGQVLADFDTKQLELFLKKHGLLN